MNREYKTPIIFDEDTEVYTLEEFNHFVKEGWYGNNDGSGYFVKVVDDEFLESKDEFFNSEPEDATHVVWYNK